MITSNRYSVPLVLSCVVLLLFFVYTDFYYVTIIGIALSSYYFFSLIYLLGKEIPLKQFILSVASFQWIIGAKLSYIFGDSSSRYYMAVDEVEYMNFIVLCVIFFHLGLFLINQKISLIEIKNTLSVISNKETKKKILSLIFLGIIFNLFVNVFRLTSNFLFMLLSQLINVGVVYALVFYGNKKKATILFFYLLFLFFSFLYTGMLSNLVLPLLFSMLYFVSKGTRFATKLFFFTFLFFLAFSLQTIKQEYRTSEIKGNGGISGLALNFFSIVGKNFEDKFKISEQKNDDTFLEESTEVNNRINQGWIISKTLENVPKNIDYLQGSTIKEAIKFIFLPRMVFIDKTDSRSALKVFEKTTGIKLVNNTSMGFSAPGEFYANFGKFGAWISMCFYGLFISLILLATFKLPGNSSPEVFLWIPLLFIDVIKAESNLMLPLNYLVKAFIFLFIIKFIFKLFRINLFSSSFIPN